MRFLPLGEAPPLPTAGREGGPTKGDRPRPSLRRAWMERSPAAERQNNELTNYISIPLHTGAGQRRNQTPSPYSPGSPPLATARSAPHPRREGRTREPARERETGTPTHQGRAGEKKGRAPPGPPSPDPRDTQGNGREERSGKGAPRSTFFTKSPTRYRLLRVS